MNIGPSLNEPVFAPVQPTSELPRQDNERRERVAPAEQADAFAGRDQRREQGNTDLELYDARGRRTTEAGTDSTRESGKDEPTAQPGEQQETQATDTEADNRPTKPSGEPMSEEEVAQLRDLQQRDQEVRTHEQQHAAVGGQHAGAPGYEYETGPDGKQYAVEGEVQVDMSPVPDDPEATIEKMQQIKAAALAPAEPSQADKSAAARAEQLISEARAELQEQQREQPDTGAERPAANTRPAGDTPSDSPDTTASTDSAGSPRASLQSDDASASPVMDNSARMQQRNDVIAGVYGRSAERQARALIGLA